MALNFEAFRARVYAARPDWAAQGLLDNGPQDLDKIDPGLAQRFLNPSPDDPVVITNKSENVAIPFRFNAVAAATPMTRDEFIAQQKAEAERLRLAILADPDARQALQVLAADADTWGTAYLAALEQAGLIRPVDQAPPVRQDPKVMSLMSTLATGILIGPAGDQYQTQADLIGFFAKVHQWYGDRPHTMASIDHFDTRITPDGDIIDIPVPKLPEFADYNQHLSHATQFLSFNIFAPLVGFGDAAAAPDLASVNATNDLSPFELSRYLQEVAAQGQLASIVGPQAYGTQQYLPTGYALPYTVRFANPSDAGASVSEVRIVTPLDTDLDPRSFRLADLKIGDINVHVPANRATFQGDFDFTNSKGFILRVSAGIEPQSGTATWLLQAIDPDTGEVMADRTKGLLAPGASGSISYTVAPKIDALTGAKITATARVLFNTQPAVDAASVEQTLDAKAPTTTLDVRHLAGGDDYQVSWQAVEDAGGSGVKHVTVYVAEDGGDFKIWLKQTADTTGVYQGQSGHTYEFLALATDNAGNRERPPLGVSAPEDGSQVNLGELATAQTTQDTEPPAPLPTPSTNPLFVEAQRGIPAVSPLTSPSEFDTVLNPFSLQAFATGFADSHAGVGALAILEMPDGSVLVSGGQNRGWIYKFTKDGGSANVPWAELDDPVFNLALDKQDQLWATTGGGALLLLDSFNGSVLGRFGDSITQALAVDPASGKLYVSSGAGVEIFDQLTRSFKHFSDVRVDDLQFSPQGELWGTSWPERGTLLKFDGRGRATPMAHFDGQVDSIAFGKDGTRLAGLLFVSTNLPLEKDKGSTLEMLDVATLNRVTLARGGERGEVLRTTADGRVLIAETHQVDELSPLIAPLVASSTPADAALAPLPVSTVTVSFDHDMFVGDATDLASVLNPANYSLTRAHGAAATIRGVRYDAATRTALLDIEPLVADDYTLRVAQTVKSTQGLALGAAYTAQFTALMNFTDRVSITFAATRSDRFAGTVSYDVRVTNTGDSDLIAPITLVIDPAQYFAGQPDMVFTQSSIGLWLIDLSSAVSGGRLRPGESTIAQTVTLRTQTGLRADAAHGVFAVPFPNTPPVIDSTPVRSRRRRPDVSAPQRARGHDPEPRQWSAQLEPDFGEPGADRRGAARV